MNKIIDIVKAAMVQSAVIHKPETYPQLIHNLESYPQVFHRLWISCGYPVDKNFTNNIGNYKPENVWKRERDI